MHPKSWTNQSSILGGAFFMSKYTEEFKILVVKKYLDNKMPIQELAKELKIHRSLILLWIKKYNRNGFINKRGKTKIYSSEFKLKVLNYQMETNLSDRQIAIKFGIAEHGTVSTWRKKYIAGGVAALKDARGRPKKMPKSVIPDKPREEWTKYEELAALKAENLYLKKLWALIQEEKEQITAKEKENSEPVEN